MAKARDICALAFALAKGAMTLGRLAIFIDGGYIDRIAMDEFGVRPDFGKLSEAIADEVRRASLESVDLFRTLYYHCAPYQSNPPTSEEARRFGNHRRFFDALQRLPKYEVREGRLQYKGDRADGSPIFEQKRVDLMLGLDFALLAGKNVVTHMAILSGDSDMIPAVDVAKREGVSVHLIHGPKESKVQSYPTYHHELWLAADDRFELTQAFMNSVAR